MCGSDLSHLCVYYVSIFMSASPKPRLQWSPEQISGWLKEEYPDVLDMQISHETIYRSLFIQAQGVLPGGRERILLCMDLPARAPPHKPADISDTLANFGLDEPVGSQYRSASELLSFSVRPSIDQRPILVRFQTKIQSRIGK